MFKSKLKKNDSSFISPIVHFQTLNELCEIFSGVDEKYIHRYFKHLTPSDFANFLVFAYSQAKVKIFSIFLQEACLHREKNRIIEYLLLQNQIDIVNRLEKIEKRQENLHLPMQKESSVIELQFFNKKNMSETHDVSMNNKQPSQSGDEEKIRVYRHLLRT